MGRRIIHISIFPPTVIYILEKKNHQIQGNNNLKKWLKTNIPQSAKFDYP